MRCAACDAELTASAFPGGLVPCARCGAQNRVPAPAALDVPASPYRTADARPVAVPPAIACPFCGGACSGDARACPHCDVHLSAVRCPTCFALQPTGRRTCARCKNELALEPLADPTDAPCPRCDAPLEALPGDGGMHECARCGGLFVDHPTLARIVEEREHAGALPVPDARPFEIARRGGLTETSVTYVKCPLCHERMNRVNFGRRSGVVVDVCKRHGTWFDTGELTRAVEWVSSGGLEAARAAQRSAERAGRTSSAHIEPAQAIAAVHMMSEAMRETRDLARHASLTEDLVDAALRALLGW